MKTASVEKAARKKPSAGKGAAEKPARAKAAAKKTTTRATTAKKARAKAAPAPTKTAKAGSKKAASPKSGAKRASAGKRALSSAAAGGASKASAPAKQATRRTKVPFKVGDKVVYPHHGAATIIRKERHEFDGAEHDYFVLEVATDQLTVRVPTSKAVELGVRSVISKTTARKVFATFKEEPEEAGANWSRWYKLLTEKINSGDIFQVAEVVRDLTYAQQTKGISPALKRMLAKARVIIVSELRFALGIEEEEAIKRLDRSLPKVEEPVEV